LHAENRRLETIAADLVGLRRDAAELARLRAKSAALQQNIRKVARPENSADPSAPALPPRRLSEKTAQVFTQLGPLQRAKDWTAMMGLLDSLIPQVEPTSYDMALILDLKAKLYITQGQHKKAIEPWEKALQLSDQFKYFGDQQSCDIVNFLAQLRLQSGGVSAEAPQALWF
jgi:tetratricopeptide (TPR) repeat protein